MKICSLEDAVLSLHDRSMDPDPRKAASGRLGKVLIQELNKWVEDELERGTQVPEIIWAVQETGITMTISIAVSFAKAGHVRDMLEAVKDAQIDLLDLAIEHLSK